MRGAQFSGLGNIVPGSPKGEAGSKLVKYVNNISTFGRWIPIDETRSDHELYLEIRWKELQQQDYGRSFAFVRS